jgi:hypothetical protein
MTLPKVKPATRKYFTEAEQGALRNVCSTWRPTTENIELLHKLFKGRHTKEEIQTEFAFFLEQDVKWAARCAMDKSQGQVNPEAANRAFASPNIVPLFTFTPEDTKELYEVGMKLMERSQRDVSSNIPFTSTSVHHHLSCELIHFARTKEGKAFQKLLDKHQFNSRATQALQRTWLSAAADRRTARRLGKNLRFSGFLNLMKADATARGQGIEAHVDQDVAIGAIVLCLCWDGHSLGLYEVDDQGQRLHVDILEGSVVWVNGGCVHGVELNQRPSPRLTFNTFVYHTVAVDATLSDLSQQQSQLKVGELSVVQKDTIKAKRIDFKATLETQGIRKSPRLV